MRSEEQIESIANTLNMVRRMAHNGGELMDVQIEVLAWVLGDESDQNRFSGFVRLLHSQIPSSVLDEAARASGNTLSLTGPRNVASSQSIADLLVDDPPPRRRRGGHR